MDLSHHPIHEATEQALEAIGDPKDRFVEAARLSAEARKRVVGVPPKPNIPGDLGEPSDLLVERNEACRVLHLKYGWSKSRCANYLGVDRRTLNVGMDLLSSVVPDLSLEEATAALKEAHGHWEEQASIWKTATEIRDELIHKLTSGECYGGRVFQNAELATDSVMTTPGVAQVRRQSGNQWKRDNPEKVRARRQARTKGARAVTVSPPRTRKASGGVGQIAS